MAVKRHLAMASPTTTTTKKLLLHLLLFARFRFGRNLEFWEIVLKDCREIWKNRLVKWKSADRDRKREREDVLDWERERVCVCVQLRERECEGDDRNFDDSQRCLCDNIRENKKLGDFDYDVKVDAKTLGRLLSKVQRLVSPTYQTAL